MDIRFTGALAVVTGGASGIGAACATLFVASGARVVIADKNGEAARKMAQDLGAFSAELDVTDEDQVRGTAEAIEAEHGAVEILVNSAGVLQRPLPPDQLSLKEWDIVARVDLRGTYLCCAAFGNGMARRGRGAIVNIASVAGMRASPLHSYGPAKAGVISLTECLAAEWGPAGVRVNAVSPGFTRTPALAKGIEKGVLDPKPMTKNSALGRLIEPEEIAAAVVFLSSAAASGITGVNLPVEAGYLVATPWASYGDLRSNPSASQGD